MNILIQRGKPFSDLIFNPALATDPAPEEL